MAGTVAGDRAAGGAGAEQVPRGWHRAGNSATLAQTSSVWRRVRSLAERQEEEQQRPASLLFLVSLSPSNSIPSECKRFACQWGGWGTTQPQTQSLAPPRCSFPNFPRHLTHQQKQGELPGSPALLPSPQVDALKSSPVITHSHGLPSSLALLTYLAPGCDCAQLPARKRHPLRCIGKSGDTGPVIASAAAISPSEHLGGGWLTQRCCSERGHSSVAHYASYLLPLLSALSGLVLWMPHGIYQNVYSPQKSERVQKWPRYDLLVAFFLLCMKQ